MMCSENLRFFCTAYNYLCTNIDNNWLLLSNSILNEFAEDVSQSQCVGAWSFGPDLNFL